jgi:hypothetical protein
VTLLVLGAAIPILRRGERSRGRRRWIARAVAVVGGVLVLYLVVLPIGLALWSTHRYREPVADTLRADHEQVVLRTEDGLDLAAWYIPSRNGAAVLVSHGGGGDRSGAAAHADLLAEHGFGVLLWDARGRGESDGDPDALGWTWGPDVEAALDFLAERDDVNEGQIGALGISTGADVLIEAAADDERIQGLVADGATIRSVADVRRLPGTWSDLPYWWATYTATEILSGAEPGPPLAELVTRVEAPVLLISTGTGPEQKANRVLHEAAPDLELWELPAVGHTQGIHEERTAYERRVAGFLATALGVEGG